MPDASDVVRRLSNSGHLSCPLSGSHSLVLATRLLSRDRQFPLLSTSGDGFLLLFSGLLLLLSTTFKMAFSFLIPDGGAASDVVAAARGPDTLVRLAAGHPLLVLGAPYFRAGGAAAPAAGVPVALDCIQLADLEGLLCEAACTPDGPGAALFGTQAFTPAFLEQISDRVFALVDPPRHTREVVAAVKMLARAGGAEYDPVSDVFDLAPFALPGNVGERPGQPGSWSEAFALANVPFSSFADDDSNLMGAYAALRRAVGEPGTVALRRAEQFASVARLLHRVAPRADIP